jgi:hypothetical protein
MGGNHLNSCRECIILIYIKIIATPENIDLKRNNRIEAVISGANDSRIKGNEHRSIRFAGDIR